MSENLEKRIAFLEEQVKFLTESLTHTTDLLVTLFSQLQRASAVFSELKKPNETTKQWIRNEEHKCQF